MSQREYTDERENDVEADAENGFLGRNVSDRANYPCPPNADAGNVYYMGRMFEMLIAEGRRRDEVLTRMLDRLVEKNASTLTNNSQPVNDNFDSSSTSFHVMPDLSKVITIFNGESDSLGPDNWIGNIETSARLNRWPNSYVLETARAHLRGPALNWYKSKQQVINTWEDFKKEFIKSFRSTSSLSEKWDKMRRRRQYRNESVVSYYYDKLILCQALKLDQEETKQEILAGLYYRDIAAILAVNKYTDLDILLQDIIATEKVKMTADTTRNWKINQNGSFKDHQRSYGSGGLSNKNDGDSAVWTKKVAELDQKPIKKCFKCGSTEHLANHCLKKGPVCFHCKKEGHMKNQCPRKIQMLNGKNQNFDVVENMVISKDLKFQKDIIFNGVYKLSGFIDTGSAVCTVREVVARKLNLSLEKDRQPLFSFGDQTKPVLFTKGMIMARIQVDDVTVEGVPLLVVHDEAQDTDLLLGRTFLDMEHVAFVRKGDILYFGNAEETPFKDMNLEELVTTMKIGQSLEIDGKSCSQLHLAQPNAVIKIINTSEERLFCEAGKILKITDEVDIKKEEKCELLHERQPMDIEMVPVGKKVTKEQKFELYELITEFRDCFALNLKELGCTNLAKMDIVDNNVPIRCAPYKTSQEDRSTIAKIVNELKECGIVAETNSPYSSPVLLVRKKNGDPRMVVDYRKLNNQTVKINFPIPSMDEQFEFLAGAKIFATLDLANGYMQIPLTESASKKTAFITEDTTGEFRRMIFGLTNAPYEFVKLMNLVLGPLKNRICSCYLDDIIVPAPNWDELLHRLRIILEAIRQARLTLNLKKCEFGKDEVNYLGMKVCQDGLKPGEQKLLAIEKFKQPENVHEVKRFLGLTGFFRRFVKHYAKIAQPLTDLTKQGNIFNFNEVCAAAFRKLIMCLTNSPVLRLYDPKTRTELHTDACALGIAGMLMQRDEKNALHLVYCVSKKTTEAESKYHSSRLELLAIVWCVERLRSLLIGINFKIVTDCQAIIFLNSKKNVNPQVARWFSILQEYDYTIEHRKGQTMTHVDALSRAPVETENDTQDEVFEKKLTVCWTTTEEEQLLYVQYGDETLRNIIDILKKPVQTLTENEKALTKDYKLVDNKLCIVKTIDGEQRKLFVIPKSMRKSVLVKHHDLVGHFALDRTISRIMNKYWFPGVRRYARKHISGCIECLLNKVPSGKKPGLLNVIPTPSRPFERVHVDNLGPFIKTSRGNSYIFIIIDALTRFTVIYPIKSTKTSSILRCINECILRFGKFKTIVCDRGTCFTSAQFKKYCQDEYIQLILTSPRHPQGNGMVERVNRTIIPVIQAEMKNERSWDQCLKQVEYDLNSSMNKTTRQAPFKMLYGYVPDTDKLETNLQDRNKYINPEIVREKAQGVIVNSQNKYKALYDKRKYVGHIYDVGEIVVIKAPTIQTGESTKLQPKYKGPFVVMERLPADTYRIRKIQDTDGKYLTTAHVSQMKGYYNHNESESEEDEDGEENKHDEAIPKTNILNEDSESGEDRTINADKTQKNGNTIEKNKRIIRRPKRYEDYIMKI